MNDDVVPPEGAVKDIVLNEIDRDIVRMAARLLMALDPGDMCFPTYRQQGLLLAWRALSGGAEVRDPRAWLYRIVHNVAITAVRAGGELGDAGAHRAGAEHADHGGHRRCR